MRGYRRGAATDPARPPFVVHGHRKPRPHFDLRLEADGCCGRGRCRGVCRSRSDANRLAIAVADHDVDHLTYTDADESIADIGGGKNTTAPSDASCSPCTAPRVRGATR
jgi:hypothetical protein